MSGAYDRTPIVKIELQLRPSPPDDAKPYWYGYGSLCFYDGPAYAEGRVVKVWDSDLHELTERSSWSAKVERREGSGWVLVLRLAHTKAREALAALHLPDFVAADAMDRASKQVGQ